MVGIRTTPLTRRKIISDSGRGIRGGVRVSRKCTKKRCVYYGTYRGERYLITSDAMMSLGLLRKSAGKLEVKIGRKWVKFK